MSLQVPESFYRVSIKALILDETKTKFLMYKDDTHLRDFLGGWLDFGEDPTHGIQRELAEEAWLEAIEISSKPMYFITAPEPDGLFQIAHVFYEVKIKDLNFTPSEGCKEINFFSLEDIQKEKLYPHVREFMKQFNPAQHKE